MTETGSTTRQPGASAPSAASQDDPAIDGMLSSTRSVGLEASPPSDLAQACRWAERFEREAAEPGGTESRDEAELDAASARYDAVFRRAIAEPSQNLEDLQAKAALAAIDYERQLFAHHDADRNVRREAELDDCQRLIRVVLREIGLVHASAAPASFIAAQAVALMDQIEREWPLMDAADNSSDDHPAARAAFEAAYARRDLLLDAVDALPATCRESRLAKALGRAWYDWAQIHGEKREALGSHHRLVFDISASLSKQGDAAGASEARPSIGTPIQEEPEAPVHDKGRRLDLEPEFDDLAARLDEVAGMACVASLVRDDLLRQQHAENEPKGYVCLLLKQGQVVTLNFVVDQLETIASRAQDAFNTLEDLIAALDVRVRRPQAQEVRL